MDTKNENLKLYEGSQHFSIYFYIVTFLFLAIIATGHVIGELALLYKPYILFIVHLFQVILVSSMAIQLWLSTRFDLTNIVVQQGALIGAIALVEIAALALSEYMLFSNSLFDGQVAKWLDLLVILLLPVVLLIQTVQKPTTVTNRYRMKVYIWMFVIVSAIILGSYITFRLYIDTFPFEAVATARYIVLALAISVSLYTLSRYRANTCTYKRVSMAPITNMLLLVYLLCYLLYTDVNSISYIFIQLSEIATFVLLFRMMYYVSVEQPYLRLEHNKEQMWTIAYYDEVTQLPNKRYLPTLLAEGCHTIYIAIKVERLPYIRSILGEESANEFMRLFVERLEKLMPQRSTLGRLDENHLLLACEPQSSREQEICERLVRALNEPLKMHEYALQPNPILGVSLFLKHSTEPAQLIKMARIAMEDAIIQQKSYEVYEGKLAVEIQQNLQLEHDLPSAITNNEMYLEYQPKLNMQTGKVDSMEALLRWCQSSGEFISPLQFIPILERTGMMAKVGRWILKQACYDAVQYERKHGIAIQVAVNLSVSQLMQQTIVDDVNEALRVSGLAPHLLELEITESMSMNSDMMFDILQQLKALGVQIAIDDFGTGYSSLSYLKDFPADTLKVDRSFVELVGQGNHGEAILEAVITLARKLQLNIVAEGIETNEQLQYVRERGCHYIQGYYISKPLRMEHLADKLQSIHRMSSEGI